MLAHISVVVEGVQFLLFHIDKILTNQSLRGNDEGIIKAPKRAYHRGTITEGGVAAGLGDC